MGVEIESVEFGWVENRREVARVLESMGSPLFGLQAEPAVLDDQPRDTAFWVAEEILFDMTLPAHYQKLGDCVAQGFGRGAQDLWFMELAEKPAGEPSNNAAKMVSTESVYGLSRVEVGKGQLGRRDGSVGAWAAKAVTRYGVLARGKYPNLDLRAYEPQIARDWGYDGVPDDLQRIAEHHPIQRSALIINAEDGRVAIQNGFPVPTCSNQGFTQERERNTGICHPLGTWKHCMLARGFLILKGNRWVVVLQQSWGNNPWGPDLVQLESGRTIRLPQGGFCVDMDVWNGMLRQHDSWALAGARLYERLAQHPIHLL